MLDYKNLLTRQQVVGNFCISLKNSYFFAPIPKVAHSTLKLLFAQMEIKGLPINPKTLKVHSVLCSPFVHPYQLPDAIFEKILTSDDYFRFGLVRNPQVRIVSCYLDKICRDSPERRIIEGILHKKNGETIEFVDFLKAIQQQNVAEMNKHWKPQHAILLLPHIKYHFLGKMENFDDDVSTIFRKIFKSDLKDQLEYKTVVHHATNADEHYRRFIDDAEACRLIGEIYALDFKYLPYAALNDKP